MEEEVTAHIDGATVPVFLSLPPAPAPGVLVLSEAWGLNDDIRRICRRFGDAGYVAAAPDLFDGGDLACLTRAFVNLARGRGRLVDRGRVLLEWLESRPEVTEGRVGLAGFCLGGGFALLLGSSARVCAAMYAQVPSAEALAESCPVVASYGGRDRVYGRSGETLRRRLEDAGIDNDVKVYTRAGHGFMNRAEGHRVLTVLGRPLLAVGYDDAAAEDSWHRILEFFGRHL